MIIKGKSRTGPEVLGRYLGNAEKNERISVVEIKGTVSKDLIGALVEMDAYAECTRCEKPLYHAQISPEPPFRLSPEQVIEAVDALEKQLGLEGHARVVVMHEKDGRQHFHPVWTRIDLDQMKSVSDSHNYRKHEEVARDLERRFGHPRVQGAHAERDGVERPDRTPSRAELRQEERTGIKGRDVKADVTAAFRASDNAEAFHAALDDAGYILAKGDRRDFVIVDRAGGIHSLARRIEGMKAAELREFMAPIDRESLPTTEDAREVAKERERQAEQAREDARIEKAYARGDDYVSQTQAALKDHQRRQDGLNSDEPRPERPPEHETDEERVARILGNDHDRHRVEEGAPRSEDEERIARILADDHDRHRIEQQRASEPGAARERKGEDQVSEKFGNVEMTEAQQQRMERMQDNAGGEHSVDRDDWDPDRQSEAPGGGRTRGQ